MDAVLKETLKYALRSTTMIAKEIALVDRLYSYSDEELRLYKEERFLAIVRSAMQKSAFYQKLYAKEGIEVADIRSLDDISLLPPVTKDMVRQGGQSLLTVPRWRVIAAGTSGTTGTPLTAYHSYSAIRLEQAYTWIRRKLCGFTYGDKLISVRGHLGNQRVAAYARLMNTLFLSSYLINEDRCADYFRNIEAFSAKAIEGYPSSLYNLALLFRDRGIAVKVPLCFTSSESLFPFQQKLIEEVFHTRIFDYYGCTERVVALSQLPTHEGYREDPGYAICEIRDDHLLGTSLINSSFPLIRYRVDDVVLTAPDGTISAVSGRAEDVVICKDGTRLGRLDHIFKNVRGIDMAQIVQEERGAIKVNIVLSPEAGVQVLDVVESKIRERVDPENLQVVIRPAGREDIVYTSRGKFSLVKSLLPKS